MKFEEGLKAVLKKIEINESDHNDFLDDVETITSEINKAMEAKNSIFKDMLKGLKTTAMYLKDTSIDVPENMQFLLDYKLPFEVEVVIDEDDGLKLKTTVKHPIVRDGFVDVDVFYFLMKYNLELVLSKMKPISCKNDRKFKLSFTFPTITATEQLEVGCKITIDFTFLPVVSFDMGEGRKYVFFMPDRPLNLLENAVFKTENVGPHFRDVYRLLKMLQIKYSGKDEIESFFVVITSVLDAINSNITGLGTLFIKSLKRIVSCENDTLMESIISGCPIETTFCKNIEELLCYFLCFQLMDSVKLDDMLGMFKLS